MMLLGCFVARELLCLVRLCICFPCMHSFPTSRGIDVGTSVFAASTRPRLKKRYHNYVERVREYLETIKD